MKIAVVLILEQNRQPIVVRPHIKNILKGPQMVNLLQDDVENLNFPFAFDYKVKSLSQKNEAEGIFIQKKI